MIKKTVFKFWLLNILTIIILFVTYRIVISETETASENNWESFLSIIEILINLGLSFIFVVGSLVFSLANLLNLWDVVRRKKYLSLMSFFFLPFLAFVGYHYIFYVGEADIFNSIFGPFTLFSISYLIMLGLQYIFFRRKLKKIDLMDLKNEAHI